jgi:hypothetical protein
VDTSANDTRCQGQAYPYIRAKPVGIFPVFPSKFAISRISNREQILRKCTRPAAVSQIGGPGFPPKVRFREAWDRPNAPIPCRSRAKSACPKPVDHSASLYAGGKHLSGWRNNGRETWVCLCGHRRLAAFRPSFHLCLHGAMRPPSGLHSWLEDDRPCRDSCWRRRRGSKSRN